MASLMQVLRRIGGAKAPPTTGSAGELAIYKAGATPTDAMSLYAHDGTQWIEVLDTRGKVVAPHLVTSAAAAPASPRAGDFWLNTTTNLLSIWDGASWLSTDTHQAATSVIAPVNPTTGSMWLDPGKKELMVWDGSQWANVAFKNVTNTFTKPQIIDVNDASAALHIKQLGAGAALYIEDEANPDASPFVVDAGGHVGIGTPAPNAPLEVRSSGALTIMGRSNSGTLANDTSVYFSHVPSADPAQRMATIVVSGNDMGSGSRNTVLQVDGNNNANLTNMSPTGILCLGTGGKEQLRVRADGTLLSVPTYNNAFSGANVVITSGGELCRASSSIKYKKDVEDLDVAIVDRAIAQLRPVWYRSKRVGGDDKAHWSHIGLIAEEVDKVEPRLVNYKTVEVEYDDKGHPITTPIDTPIPEDVDYARLAVLLLSKVQRLEKRIEALEARP